MKWPTIAAALAILVSGAVAAGASDRGDKARVGKSALGPYDQLGRLSIMTDATRAAVLARIAPGRVYDLAVPFFTGMPAYTEAGDPPFSKWMTHTPDGFARDNPTKLTEKARANVTYSGDAISMYVHTGTHIDGLSHFGLHGEIWNGFKASEHRGDNGWDVNGIETMPPIVARGVLVDVPALKGVAELPPGYRVTADDVRQALARSGVTIARGDVVLVRTGRMAKFRDAEAYSKTPPGLGIDAAKFIAAAGAMIVGVDVQSPDVLPPQVDDNFMPLHTFFLGESGMPILENVDMETLARDRVAQFAFIAAPLKIEHATGSPLRPLAFPLR